MRRRQRERWWAGAVAATIALAAVFAAACNRERPLPDPPLGLADPVTPSPWPKPRVVLFIVIDTLRADHVGAYGAGPDSTPALDDLAKRSFVFDQATATSSWTRSSIASMLTARYPTSLHVLGRDDAISDDATTVAEILSAHGWRTAGVFSNGNASPELGFAQGVAEVRRPTVVNGYPHDFQKFTAEGVTAEAVASLRAWHASGPSAAPLFLFVHYIDPHDPYLPHPDLMPSPEPAGHYSGARPELDRLDHVPPNELAASDVARIKHLYEGEVRYCDRWVGKLLDEVDALGVGAHAMIVVTADHGEGLWDHGRRGHGVDLYQEQIRVPLFVHYPGMAAKDAARIAAPVSLLDLVPTLLGALAIERPAELEGHDLAPLTVGRARAAALAYVYAELDLDGRVFQAMRLGPAKLILRHGDVSPPLKRPKLFQLDADPGERDDLGSHDDQRALIQHLTTATERWAAAIAGRGAATQPKPAGSLDPKLQEQLRGLGYVQ
jgi:arylsulfatase A-like enzyme